MTQQFGGFAYVDADLSEASVRLDAAGMIVIDGVKIMDATGSMMMEEQTISLKWSKADQGFMVSDIMDPPMQ